MYIDCGMGCAGDMFTAALLEASGKPKELLEKLNSLGLPGVRFEAEPSVKCGITGTHVTVTVNGEEESEHMHEHHGVAHVHQNLAGIEHIVNDHLNVSEKVRAKILSVYQLIAEAESQVHGVPVEEIHFHEVGAMDAVADITAVCVLMEELGVRRVIASPVHAGSGTVKCAHGILPVPAPATAILLKGIPFYSREEIKGELCTPTGAALLKTFVSSFDAMPIMRVDSIGYGMGKKDFPQANCVRVMIGECEEAMDKVLELRFNVDDMTAEEIGFAQQVLLEHGAVEVFLTPVQMKKNRPGTLFTVLVTMEKREELVRLIFRHTSTLGIREFESRRHVMKRSVTTEETPLGPVRIKRAEGYGVVRSKYEYDDLAVIAEENGISIREVREQLKS